jgi:hypothetical protein
MFKKILPALIIAAAASGQAVTLNYDYAISGSHPSSGSLATLTITQAGTDAVDFLLAYSPTAPTGSFISNLWLNVSPFVAGVAISNQSSKVAGYAYGSNSHTDTGLQFDGKVSFNSGQPSTRLGVGQSASWRLTGTGLTESSFVSTATKTPTYTGPNVETYSMIHIQGIPVPGGGTTGVKLGSVQPVPEPATLCALALGAVSLLRRRKKA